MIELTRQMRDLLAKASVVAEGPTAKIDPNKVGGHAKPGGMAPKGTATGLYEAMRRRFVECQSERDQHHAIKWAREALEQSGRAAPPPPELMRRDTLPWKRQIAREAEKAMEKGSKQTLRRVAQLHGVSHETVRQYRLKYGEGEAA